MSRRKVDMVAEEYYAPFLHGDAARFQGAPATTRTALIERMYMRVLSELAINRFKWTGLPNSVDKRFLETTLFYRALSVFYYEEKFDRFMALQATPAGRFNMYNNPTGYQVTGQQFVNRTLSAKDCVPIWSNAMRIPDMDIIRIFSSRLAQLDTTIEINAKSARRGKVGFGSENQRMSLVNLNRQMDEGVPFIQLNSDAITGVPVQAVDLGVDPDTIINIDILWSRQWNKCMSLLGINNSNQDKKERLVASEVEANNDQVAASRWVNLNARQDAAYKISHKYGLNVTVDYHDGASPIESESGDN